MSRSEWCTLTVAVPADRLDEDDWRTDDRWALLVDRAEELFGTPLVAHGQRVDDGQSKDAFPLAVRIFPKVTQTEGGLL
jgi:hypothetical protein